MADKPCKHCGKQFRTRPNYKHKAKYCNKTCEANARRTRPKTATRHYATRAFLQRIVAEVGKCEGCGTTGPRLHGHHKLSVSKHPELELERSNVEVLCPECHAKEHPQLANLILHRKHHESHKATCRNCGKDFLVTKSDLARRKHCSKECASTAIRKSWPGRFNPGKGYHRAPFVTITCVICGTKFDVCPSEAVRRVTCSRECSSKHVSQKMSEVWPQKTCQHCGSEYECRPAQVEKSRFCSRSCAGKAWQARQMEQRKSHLAITRSVD